MLVFVSNKSNKRSHSHAQLIACPAGTYQHVGIGAGLAAFPQAAETRSQAGTWSACATCCTTFLLCLLLRLSPPVLRLQFACRVQRGAAQSCAALSRHYCHAYVYPDAGCCYRPWRRDHAQNARRVRLCGAVPLVSTKRTQQFVTSAQTRLLPNARRAPKMVSFQTSACLGHAYAVG